VVLKARAGTSLGGFDMSPTSSIFPVLPLRTVVPPLEVLYLPLWLFGNTLRIRRRRRKVDSRTLDSWTRFEATTLPAESWWPFHTVYKR
jgi:hypothetical protein